MTPQPLAFAHKMDEALRSIGQIPLYLKPPQLNLSYLSSALASKFKNPRFTLSVEGTSWLSSAAVHKELNSDVLSLQIHVAPLTEGLLWIMSKKDVSLFANTLLKSPATSHHVGPLQKGFFLYAAIQALDAIQTLEPLHDFSFRLSEESHPLSDQNYCVDLKLSMGNHPCFGRLVLPSSFLSAWNSHFASLRSLFSLSPLAKTLEVPVGLRIGSVLLNKQEWTTVERGDLLLLDRGSYDPRHKEGVASLSIGTTSLFHVKVKDNKIKILEPALVYEEGMDQQEIISETPKPVQTDEERSTAVKELPLFVTVELARLRMTVDQLMHLAPGTFLELPIHPEQGVTLSVNGQRIARGELVHLGEVLGVRVLETSE